MEEIIVDRIKELPIQCLKGKFKAENENGEIAQKVFVNHSQKITQLDDAENAITASLKEGNPSSD